MRLPLPMTLPASSQFTSYQPGTHGVEWGSGRGSAGFAWQHPALLRCCVPMDLDAVMKSAGKPGIPQVPFVRTRIIAKAGMSKVGGEAALRPVDVKSGISLYRKAN